MSKIIDMKYHNFENLMNDCLNVIRDADLTSAQGKELLIKEIFKVFNEHNKQLIQIITKGNEDLNEAYMELFTRIGGNFIEQKEFNEVITKHKKETSDFIENQIVINQTLIDFFTKK
jgi:S-adenosylmethionine synthetase